MNLWSQEGYVKAWNFASRAHKDQKVPGGEVPYINHIGNVVMEVMTAIAGCGTVERPDLAVQCALLHDVLEDTAVTYEQMIGEFGPDIADGVMALTKNSDLQNKVEQMQDSLRRIKEQPKEIWMVKLADRITNLQPPPRHWEKDRITHYHQEAMMIHTSLHEANAELSSRFLKKLEDYKAFFQR